MNEKQSFETLPTDEYASQRGQSIVLITFMLIGLLAFAGIAIDSGFTFARSTQLQAAVDAAALAAVTELTGGDINDANTKAGQFLNTNGVPVATTIVKNGVPITTTMTSSTAVTELGATEYTLTVTWPVEHYFLQLVGWNVTDLTKSATAAYFPLADVYASRRVESGVLSTSNQSVFGPSICTSFGDPFSPFNSPYRPNPPVAYAYNYRILIPSDYDDPNNPNSTDVLRVELFDPDSINAAANTYAVSYSANAMTLDSTNFPPGTYNKSCSSSQRDPCLIETGERNLVNPNGSPPVELDQINPFWFARIDENRGAGSLSGHGNGSCGAPSSYNPPFNTATLYELFYYKQNNDGTIQRIELARYTGQVGDGDRDNGDHQTDMRWVSPGGTLPNDDINLGLPAVPVDLGSPGDFELSISNDLSGILSDPGTGNRYVYLDVTASSGASENGFEVWAGPFYPDVPSNVNTRNLTVLNNPGAHAAKGVTIFGIGRLPMNSNINFAVDIPLIYVGPELAGEKIHVSLFDTDAGSQPPIVFYFDSIAESDWSLTFGAGDPDPDGVSGRCKPGSCYDEWVNPSYEITIPGILDNCDWGNPTQADCTPFYGGRLIARYIGGNNDTYGWQISLSGLPYLVR